MAKDSKPQRLYQKARILGYKRARKAQDFNQVLVEIAGVKTAEDSKFYHGKACAYVYKCKREVQGSRFRVVWGKVQRAHGHNGKVRVHFRKNLPPQSFGAACRVMLYPSSV